MEGQDPAFCSLESLDEKDLSLAFSSAWVVSLPLAASFSLRGSKCPMYVSLAMKG